MNKRRRNLVSGCMNEFRPKLTCLALFVNSAAAKRINASASAVRRSDKARFLCITDRLIGEKFNISLRENDGNSHEEKERATQHVYVQEHHSKHEPNCEV